MPVLPCVGSVQCPAEDLRGLRRVAGQRCAAAAGECADSQVPAVFPALQPQDTLARHRLCQPLHR